MILFKKNISRRLSKEFDQVLLEKIGKILLEKKAEKIEEYDSDNDWGVPYANLQYIVYKVGKSKLEIVYESGRGLEIKSKDKELINEIIEKLNMKSKA